MQNGFSATAAEARARGVQHCLAPVLDLARDPRWGRTEETYGEDLYLVSRIGLAAILGFQGTGPMDGSHVMATARHFAVHVRFHNPKGSHGIDEYDWEQFLNFADRHFGISRAP